MKRRTEVAVFGGAFALGVIMVGAGIADRADPPTAAERRGSTLSNTSSSGGGSSGSSSRSYSVAGVVAGAPSAVGGDGSCELEHPFVTLGPATRVTASHAGEVSVGTMSAGRVRDDGLCEMRFSVPNAPHGGPPKVYRLAFEDQHITNYEPGDADAIEVTINEFGSFRTE